MAEESFADVHVTRCHASNIDIWWVLFTSLNSSTKALVTRHNASNIGVQQKLVRKKHTHCTSYWCSRESLVLPRSAIQIPAIIIIGVQEEHRHSGESAIAISVVLMFKRTSLPLERCYWYQPPYWCSRGPAYLWRGAIDISRHIGVQEDQLSSGEGAIEITVIIR